MSSTNESRFLWTDAYAQGYGPMDAAHQEFVECVDALIHAADDEVAERLEAFARHARAHFGAEDEWMTSTDFPARECHMNEHTAVLHSVQQVQELVAQGNYEIARDLGRELARWFPGHTDYLDSALSHWMCKQKLGGKPVIIRRDIRSGKLDELLANEHGVRE